MVASTPFKGSSNGILRHIADEAPDILAPFLTAMDMPLRMPLHHRNRQIEHVYFIEKGFASVGARSGDYSSEVGVIGREGVVGLAVIMETDRSPHETYMQVAGSGQRMATDDICKLVRDNAMIRRALLRYEHLFMVQVGYTSLSNARFKMHERLARWLLMAHDRLEGDDLSLTHEFLAVMVGVRRPVVTIGLHALAQQSLISSKRGVVTIVDRRGLVKLANGSYGASEAEYRRVFQ